MQIVGTQAEHGFTIEELEDARTKFEKSGYKTEIIDLNRFIEIEAPSAKVLVVKRGADCLLRIT